MMGGGRGADRSPNPTAVTPHKIRIQAKAQKKQVTTCEKLLGPAILPIHVRGRVDHVHVIVHVILQYNTHKDLDQV